MLRNGVVVQISCSDGGASSAVLHQCKDRTAANWNHALYAVARDVHVAGLTGDPTGIARCYSGTSQFTRCHHCEAKALRIGRRLWQRCCNWPERIATSTNEKDRKSTRLNSSHANISYAVFCL